MATRVKPGVLNKERTPWLISWSNSALIGIDPPSLDVYRVVILNESKNFFTLSGVVEAAGAAINS